MQNVNYNFSFQEVWDKDPLSQERMGQIGFTTEKLKDLGMVRTFFLSVFELGLNNPLTSYPFHQPLKIRVQVLKLFNTKLVITFHRLRMRSAGTDFEV